MVESTAAEDSDASSDLYETSPAKSQQLRSLSLPRPDDRPSSSTKRPLDVEDSNAHIVKKIKTTPAPSTFSRKNIPLEIWHRIFTFVHPKSLACLSQVSRQFHSSLTHPEYHKTVTPTKGSSRLLSSSSIWKISRIRCLPTLPSPLPGKTELGMWKLLRMKRCQECDRDGSGDAPIVWPFARRVCRECLSAGSQVEYELFMTSMSSLLPLVPFAFVSQEGGQIISTIALRNRPPPFEKVYWTKALEAVQLQIERARQVGPDAVKEQFEKLRSFKDLTMKNVESWEKWEESGGMDHLHLSFGHLRISSATEVLRTTTVISPDPMSAEPRNGDNDMPPPPSRSASVAQQGGLHRSESGARFRDRADVQEMRAARRQDIERRCLELDPPIPTELLLHMESFQAALQISTPLTDQAWDMLRPRLITQRHEAERRADERFAEVENRRRQEDLLKEIKETAERSWNESQKPVRELLEKHAEGVINEHWSSGAAVNEQNAALFAAQLLIQTRSRFMDDPLRHTINVNASSSSQPLLVLENMKWLHDNKVKPITDPLGGSLFLCSACPDSRFKALDGVIQHYAAKHTNEFGMGKTVVSWQSAAWPENPPFKSDPSNLDPRKGNHGHGFRTPGASHSGMAHPDNSQPYYVAPQPERAYSMPTAYGMSPAPFGSPVMGPPSYPSLQPVPAGSQPGSSAPPGSYASMPVNNSNQYQLYHNSNPQYPPPNSYHPTYSGHASPFAGHNPYYGPPQPPPPPAPNQPIQPPHGHPSSTPAPTDYPWAAPLNMPNAFPPMWTPVASLYQSQKTAVAETVTKLWSTLSAVNIPMSIKVYVLIQHTVSRFQEKFSNEPSLDLFTDTLNTQQRLTAVKNAVHITCKTCARQNVMERVQEAGIQMYSFYSLLIHFKHVHVEYEMMNNKPADGNSTIRLDWKEDMIELPPDETIRSIGKTSGMDPERFDLIKEVMPLVNAELRPESTGKTASRRVPAASVHGSSSHLREDEGRRWSSNAESKAGEEYDPTQPSMPLGEYGLRPGNGSHGRRSADELSVSRRPATRPESHNTTPASTAGSVRRPQDSSAGPSPVDTGSSRPKPRHTTVSPEHPADSRRPSESAKHLQETRQHGHRQVYRGSSPPDRYAERERYEEKYAGRPPLEQVRRAPRQYVEYAEGPGGRKPTVFVERGPPGQRAIYGERDGGYYEGPAGDDVEYVFVRRSGTRYVDVEAEYPPEEQYMHHTRR